MSFSFVFVEISLHILDLIFDICQPTQPFFYLGEWAFYCENHSYILIIQIQLSHYEIEHSQSKQLYKFLKALSV